MLSIFRLSTRTSMVSLLLLLTLVAVSTPCLSAEPAVSQQFQFRDVATEAGILPALRGIQGHGAGWGDVDGNGWPDLYVGTFHNVGSPNQLLLNREGKFEPASDKTVQISTRATGTVLADLDGDGDLDLYVSSMPVAAGSKGAERMGRALRGCSLFRNDGGGKFTDVSRDNGACPAAFGGRSACVLDYDGDGLLDLLVGEEPITGYNGSQTHSSRLFHNEGGLAFRDASREAGLPEGIPGLGVAAADVNNDGWPDFFLASGESGNRLFLNDGKGKFTAAPGAEEVFAWPGAKGDNMVCGVCFGDVNRDGLLDMAIGQHFERPWLEPVANRLYLNRGVKGGAPKFEDVTEKVGLIPLPMKGPHVELQDFDNDGWVDLCTSIVKFDDEGRPHPVVFRHLGLEDGLPRFRTTALSVNDFPNETDTAVTRTGTFFEKMIEEGKVIYSAPAPTVDYDRDGRIDILLANWWTESPSMLLRNETPSGNWLDVRVEGDGDKDINRMGVGSRVSVYRAGKLGEKDALLGVREIAVGFGYASAQQAVAHFGLGDDESCDVEVVLPHGRGRIEKPGVKANQTIVVRVSE
ncbi:MAG: CRTAC1 family protein [Pirellulaceae bacterium]